MVRRVIASCLKEISSTGSRSRPPARRATAQPVGPWPPRGSRSLLDKLSISSDRLWRRARHSRCTATARISEIRGLDPRTTRYDSQRVRNVEQNVDATILEVFGPDSLEYLHNRSFPFGRFASVVASDDDEAQDQFEDAIRQGVDLRGNLISRIEEQRSDLSSTATGVSPPAMTTAEHPRELNPYAILNEQLHALRSRAEALDASREPSSLAVRSVTEVPKYFKPWRHWFKPRVPACRRPGLVSLEAGMCLSCTVATQRAERRWQGLSTT